MRGLMIVATPMIVLCWVAAFASIPAAEPEPIAIVCADQVVGVRMEIAGEAQCIKINFLDGSVRGFCDRDPEG